MSEYHGRAKRAIVQLFGRQVALQVLTFVGGVVLARTLGPGPFGLYIISTFVVGLFAIVGDFGLAPSLIQRKAELTDRDLQVAFTLQQILVTGIVVAVWLTARPLAGWVYPGEPTVPWLVRALSLNLYLSSWRTMSAIQLEREVKFDRLARIEVLETVVYQGLAVGLSLAGCGTWSYVAAAMAQGLTGTVLIYAAAPWPVRVRWDWGVARDLIRYGVPFQFQSVLNAMGGWVTPLVVGRLVGRVGVGYVTWAASNGRKPLIVTDNIMRVGFPHLSRLQADPAQVERTVVRYLTASLVPAGLWFAGIYCCTPGAIAWVYKSDWVPARTALVLYAAVLPLDMVSHVTCVSLNAVGRVRLATVAVAARTVGNVALAAGLIYGWRSADRFNAVPAAYLIVSAVTIPWLLAGLGRGALPRVARQVAWVTVPTVLGIAAGLAASAAVGGRVPLSAHVLVAGVATCVGYAVGTLLAAPAWAREMAAGLVRRWRSSRDRPGFPVILADPPKSDIMPHARESPDPGNV